MDDNINNISLQIRNALDRGVPAQVIFLSLSERYQTTTGVLQKLFFLYMKRKFADEKYEQLERRINDEQLVAVANFVLAGGLITEKARNLKIKASELGRYLRKIDVWSPFEIGGPLLSNGQSTFVKNCIAEGQDVGVIAAKLNMKKETLKRALERDYILTLLRLNGYPSVKELQKTCSEGPVYLTLAQSDYEMIHKHIVRHFFKINRENLGRRSIKDESKTLPSPEFIIATARQPKQPRRDIINHPPTMVV